jgi:hypothetical protein
MQIISVEIENANSPGAKLVFGPHIYQGEPMAATSLDGGFIKVTLAHVKKKRQSERYANQESSDNRDPKSPHTEAASLCKNEDPEHQ